VVKSTGSSRGPEFKCQPPHGGSQPSVMPSSGVSEDSYSLLINKYILKKKKKKTRKTKTLTHTAKVTWRKGACGHVCGAL